jgi:hypothetical protein
MIRKDTDERFTFPGLHRDQRCECQLRVYREPGMPRVIAVATELHDNPGASITTCAVQLIGAVWRRFQPTVAHPPILVEHYNHASYPPGRPGGDRFTLVECDPLPDPLARIGKEGLLLVCQARHSHIPASFVERLVGEPIGEPGEPFRHETTLALSNQQVAELIHRWRRGEEIAFRGRGPSGAPADVVITRRAGE